MKKNHIKEKSQAAFKASEARPALSRRSEERVPALSITIWTLTGRKAEEQIGVANLDVARYAARKPVLHALYPALFIEPKALGQFGGAAIMFNEFCISHTPDITRGV